MSDQRSLVILDEYKAERENFDKLEVLTTTLVKEIISEAGIHVMDIKHRVKTVTSLLGKVNRKPESYKHLSDMTDILGVRIICYFTDEIDVIGELMEKFFVIDEEKSVDKRKLIKADSFGYLSLHYICSLPNNGQFPEELCRLQFELQIRTVLQHQWATIEHKFGYKTKFGVPRYVRREFSRLAGLLELADDEFVRVREHVKQYTEDIHDRIVENDADDVLIDSISLEEYMNYNKQMQEFLNKLASIEDSSIEYANSEIYIEQLAWLDKYTLGDLQKMLYENREVAFRLAQDTLIGTELDVIASNVALRYICRAELVNKGYTKDEIVDFLSLTVKDLNRAEKQAERLIGQYEKIMSDMEDEEE